MYNGCSKKLLAILDINCCYDVLPLYQFSNTNTIEYVHYIMCKCMNYEPTALSCPNHHYRTVNYVSF